MGDMKRYWDERAQLNAPWYVDTSLSYDEPDLDRFFETGRKIVDQALARGVPASGSGTALEIGCGLGRVTLALADHFDRVIGVDISPQMIERAKELASHERITYTVGTGSTLDGVADGSVDLVLTFTVFQHIPLIEVIESYIAEAGRVLRVGGRFVFQWNNTPGERRWRMRRALRGLRHRFGVGERHGRDAPEFLGSRVSMTRIRDALERAGLSLDHVEGEGTLYAWAWTSRR